MDKDKLRALLEEAFGDVPYPDDDNISLPNARDDGETIVELYRGRDWRSLEHDEIWGLGLHVMTPEALHYFLPAFLLASDKVDSVTGSLYSVLRPRRIRRLTPPDEWFKAKFGNYTPAQKNVVRAWLDAKLEETIAYDKKEGRTVSDEQTFLSRLREYWV